MSTKRERRQSRNPLSTIDVNCDHKNVSSGKGKKESKKNTKGSTSKYPRRPLEELQVSPGGGLPEIPVKVNRLGRLVLDDVEEKKEISTQTTEPLATVVLDKSTQTTDSDSVNHRMVCEEEPPIEYWQTLAEQRRKALIEALAENKELYEEIEELKALIANQDKLQQEAKYYSFMYKLASSD